MTVYIENQKQLQTVQKLPFCYVCGGRFSKDEQANRDHVPPTSIFALSDREPPLILKTHVQCNSGQSQDDHAIGQLISLLHGRIPNPRHKKLDIEIVAAPTGASTGVLKGLDLPAVIQRWLRAFHAALYKEPLPTPGFFSTCPPFPVGERSDGSVQPLRIPEVFSELVAELKRNRATNSLDRIVCRNGKCRYECVWSQADNGSWICIYCLDLYNWIDLGDVNNFEPRGCAGVYARPQGGMPMGASTNTSLQFELTNLSPHDPFGD